MAKEPLGEQVRRAREARGWSQADLADRVGAKQQSIQQVEAGEVLRPRYLPELAHALEIDLGLPARPAPPDDLADQGAALDRHEFLEVCRGISASFRRVELIDGLRLALVVYDGAKARANGGPITAELIRQLLQPGGVDDPA